MGEVSMNVLSLQNPVTLKPGVGSRFRFWVVWNLAFWGLGFGFRVGVYGLWFRV